MKKKHFDPEKYGMLFCPQCNGYGKSLKNSNNIRVCTGCGGFGLVRKGIHAFKMNGRPTWITKDLDASYQD